MHGELLNPMSNYCVYSNSNPLSTHFSLLQKMQISNRIFSKSQNVICIVPARSDTDYESLVLVYPFNEAVENSVYICYLHRKLQTVMNELLTIGKEKIRKTNINLYLNTASFHDCMFKSFVSNWA